MSDQLVMERFRLLERIGSGGMGTVYRAFDERLQRQVAVKQLRDSNPDRVLREAQAAARLNHPAIVTLYELGQHDGHAVLVSELVPGETLSELEASGDLCDRDVAAIVADLCEALAHAHDRGVVHRDIKPENVIVRELGGIGRRAKLMDFGIARIAGAPTLTEHGQVVGTLAYMSPEQAEGELAGPPSDVYSLALTAYECWAGENPVAGGTPAETARRIGEPVPPLHDRRPDLPAHLTETIDACLEPDPQLRPSPLELRDGVVSELADLDSTHLLPASHAAGLDEPESRTPIGFGKAATLAALALALAILAGPLGVPGAALVLAVLSVPSLLVGATRASAVTLAAPLLGWLGIGAAGSALGAAAPSALGRAILGIGAWAWMLAASLAIGAGPDLGIAAAAPGGWASDVALAADTVLAPLASFDSLLVAAIFAAAAVALGWLLAARHPAIALLGAMLWAAATAGALATIGDGSLAGNPIGLVAAATAAVALEFGILRPRLDAGLGPVEPPAVPAEAHGPFAGKLA